MPTVPVAMDRPAPTFTGKSGTQWAFHAPATTICGDPRITARCHHDEGSQGADAKTTEQVRNGDYEGTEPIRLTIGEALTLQSFRPDYPVQGTRSKQFEQVGNAVPPTLARVVLERVLSGANPSLCVSALGARTLLNRRLTNDRTTTGRSGH